MQVRVKLMATLRSKLPQGSTGGMAILPLQPGTSVAALVDQLSIPAAHIHLVTINGEMEPDRQRVLADGDELVIFPPVAGG
ncbi:MAG TPA: MoaD/ThiS family protein [Gemmataceae bacterium]|nr:MoaD/ThiS family protein [Gemmataceae bacterium]